MYFGGVFDLSDAQLLLYSERMQEIAAKNQRILERINGVYPSGRNEKRVAFGQYDATAFFHSIAEKYIALFSGQHPLFVQLDIMLGRRNQPKNLRKNRIRWESGLVSVSDYE